MNRRDLLRGTAALSSAALLERVAGARGTTLQAPVVQTSHGPVRGAVPAYMEPAPKIPYFKGIPYGMDTSRTRFAAPQPPAPWNTVRDCVEWGPRAPQVPGARHDAPQNDGEAILQELENKESGYHLPLDVGPESEDCLHLNVWTPANLWGTGKDRGKRPVMVYIHGGAYSNGTVNSALYDGAQLAHRGDVVVVTVNHRLNLFGYLYLADLLPSQGFDDSGNAGQLDLVLALRWVRDNIAHFGGDPANVLVFGQSGGGAKCATLMAQPPARGLFHRVITMSGQQVTGATRAHATGRARAALAFLQLDPGQPAETAEALRTLSWPTLQSACKAHGYFGPVTDGRSLPVDPFSPNDPQQSAHVPMMLGNTHDETRLLLGGTDPALFSLTWETLPATLEKNAPFLKSNTVSLPVPEVIAHYRAWHPEYSASDVFFAVTTDSRSWRGEVIEANARAADPVAQPRTWVYQVDWRSPVPDGRFGAPHTMELPFAFHNATLAPGMVGSSPEELRRAERMSDVLMNRFLQFARYGDPNGPAPGASAPSGFIGGLAGTAPWWPPYDLTQRATMIFDLPPRIEDDPRGRERRYLGQVPYVQPGT